MTERITLPDTFKTHAIARLFEALGGHVRFVGGCVRDALAGKPIHDIDMATPLLPDAVMRMLENAGIKVIPTGLKHGTVTAIIENHAYEITTLRRDIDCDGRHAEVEFTDDWQADASRRDFTINAMYLDAHGTLYDYFNGQADLADGVVRFVGDPKQRLDEDILRLLRFFRFHARYSEHPTHPDLLTLFNRLAPKLHGLSGERIQQEMHLLLALPDPTHTLRLMQECGITPYLELPQADMTALRHLAFIESHYHITRHAWNRLALILRQANHKTDAFTRLTKRWKLSRADGDYLHYITLSSPLIPYRPLPSYYPALRKEGKTLFLGRLSVSWAESIAHSMPMAHEELHTVFSPMYKAAMRWHIPVFPVKGSDLIERGLVAGKELGDVLRRGENWWEEKLYLPSKEEIVAYLMESSA